MENATESGVFYLVPSENGEGKRVVKRPYPPPTSVPMDENFDAYTMETRGPLTEFGERGGTIINGISRTNQIARTSSWAPTSPPLDEDFDAWTYTNTAGPVTGTGTIYEDDLNHPDSEDEDKSRSSGGGDRETGTGGYEGSESAGTKRPLRRSNGRKLGRNISLTLSASASKVNGTSATEAFRGNDNGYHKRTQQNGYVMQPRYDTAGRRELGDYEVVQGTPSSKRANGRHRNRREVDEQSLSLVRGTSRHEGAEPGYWKVNRLNTGGSRARNDKSKTQGELGLQRKDTRRFARNDHIRQTISRRGPVAHEYEVVENRVLEEGPERTVTISTWREKVAKEASRKSEVEMSVYYLGADDYVMDPGIDEGRGREEFRDSLKDQGGSRSRKVKGKQRDLLNDGWIRSEPVYYKRGSPVRPQTPWPFSNDLPDVEGEVSDQSKTDIAERPGHTLFRRSSYTEWMDREYIEPRTSTPVRNLSRKAPNGIRAPEISLRMNGKATNGASSGRRSSSKEPANGVDHSGGSASTMSTMQVASTPALEALLSSCEPSLLYLAPILVDLGIKTKEHMKAVGRLREETRNKEVREEALKRGMTIMEWAILLDKLQQNG